MLGSTSARRSRCVYGSSPLLCASRHRSLPVPWNYHLMSVSSAILCHPKAFQYPSSVGLDGISFISNKTMSPGALLGQFSLGCKPQGEHSACLPLLGCLHINGMYFDRSSVQKLWSTVHPFQYPCGVRDRDSLGTKLSPSDCSLCPTQHHRTRHIGN